MPGRVLPDQGRLAKLVKPTATGEKTSANRVAAGLQSQGERLGKTLLILRPRTVKDVGKVDPIEGFRTGLSEKLDDIADLQGQASKVSLYFLCSLFREPARENAGRICPGKALPSERVRLRRQVAQDALHLDPKVAGITGRSRFAKAFSKDSRKGGPAQQQAKRGAPPPATPAIHISLLQQSPHAGFAVDEEVEHPHKPADRVVDLPRVLEPPRQSLRPRIEVFSRPLAQVGAQTVVEGAGVTGHCTENFAIFELAKGGHFKFDEVNLGRIHVDRDHVRGSSSEAGEGQISSGGDAENPSRRDRFLKRRVLTHLPKHHLWLPAQPPEGSLPPSLDGLVFPHFRPPFRIRKRTHAYIGRQCTQRSVAFAKDPESVAVACMSRSTTN